MSEITDMKVLKVWFVIYHKQICHWSSSEYMTYILVYLHIQVLKLYRVSEQRVHARVKPC